MKSCRFSMLAVFALLSATVSPAAPANMVVIANPKLDINITQEQVAKIFLSKLRVLENGITLKPLDQAEGRAPREEFLTKVLHKTEPALKSYWSTIIFTGNGSPPETVGDDDAVKKFVAENPNGLGYIDSKSVDSTVRVILRPD